MRIRDWSSDVCSSDLAWQPTSMVDPDHPDHARYPLYADAERHKLVADLAPGDAIYMPPMWWHHVRSDGALNVLVNYWFGQRQDRFPFAALMLAMHSIRENGRASCRERVCQYV